MADLNELSRYQRLDLLHARMLEAAQHLEWDTLLSLHEESRRLVLEIAGVPAYPLDAATRQEKARLINAILEKQALITTEVKDWQKDVEPMLADWLPVS